MLLNRHICLLPAIQPDIAQKARNIVERFLVGTVEEASTSELCCRQYLSQSRMLFPTYQHRIRFLVRPFGGITGLLLRLPTGLSLPNWLRSLKGPQPRRKGLHVSVCGVHRVDALRGDVVVGEAGLLTFGSKAEARDTLRSEITCR